MKRVFSISAILLSSAALAANGPVADAVAEWNRANGTSNAVASSEGKVRFLAQSVEMDAGATIEFAVCGQSGEKDYETLFISFAKPENVCSALEAAGVSRGVPPDSFSARFWPAGQGIRFSAVNIATGKTNSLEDCVSLDRSFLPESEADDFDPDSIVYTGGTRLENGDFDASANSTCSIVALYSLPESPLLLQAPLDQSSTYGAFKAKRKMTKGELYEIVLESKNGKPLTTQNALIRPDGMIELSGDEKIPLAEFVGKNKNPGKRENAEKRLMTFSFDRRVKLAEAVKAAGMLMACKGPIAINGKAPDQIPLEAYLPEEKWRDRTKRPMQPIEIRLGETKTATCIDEDWSGEGLDPAVTARSAAFENPASLRKAISSLGEKAAATKVFFIYASDETSAGEILDTAKAANDGKCIFYVFAENKKQPE